MGMENIIFSYLFLEDVMSWEVTLSLWASSSRRFVGIVEKSNVSASHPIKLEHSATPLCEPQIARHISSPAINTCFFAVFLSHYSQLRTTQCPVPWGYFKLFRLSRVRHDDRFCCDKQASYVWQARPCCLAWTYRTMTSRDSVCLSTLPTSNGFSVLTSSGVTIPTASFEPGGGYNDPRALRSSI